MNFDATLVLTTILVFAVISIFCWMVPPEGDEPESELGSQLEVESASSLMCYDKIEVYNFICRRAAHTYDLIARLESTAEIENVSMLRSSFLEMHNGFETNGVTREGIDQLLFLHENLQLHDSEFDAFEH